MFIMTAIIIPIVLLFIGQTLKFIWLISKTDVNYFL